MALYRVIKPFNYYDRPEYKKGDIISDYSFYHDPYMLYNYLQDGHVEKIVKTHPLALEAEGANVKKYL